MIKIAVFDLLKLPNLISSKVRMPQSEKLGVFNPFQMWNFLQKSHSRTSKMIKIAVFDLVRLPNLDSYKIRIK